MPSSFREKLRKAYDSFSGKSRSRSREDTRSKSKGRRTRSTSRKRNAYSDDDTKKPERRHRSHDRATPKEGRRHSRERPKVSMEVTRLPEPYYEKLSQELVNLINAERKKHKHVHSLRVSKTLSRAACRRAKSQSKHMSPQYKGSSSKSDTPLKRVQLAGYGPHCRVSESGVAGVKTAAEVFNLCMKDKAASTNIILKDHRDIGIGIYPVKPNDIYPPNTYYWAFYIGATLKDPNSAAKH